MPSQLFFSLTQGLKEAGVDGLRVFNRFLRSFFLYWLWV